jgi:hypothetical protein
LDKSRAAAAGQNLLACTRTFRSHISEYLCNIDSNLCNIATEYAMPATAITSSTSKEHRHNHSTNTEILQQYSSAIHYKDKSGVCEQS